MIGLNTWPEKWTGEEENGAAQFDRIMSDGCVQPLLVRDGGEK